MLQCGRINCLSAEIVTLRPIWPCLSLFNLHLFPGLYLFRHSERTRPIRLRIIHMNTPAVNCPRSNSSAISGRRTQFLVFIFSSEPMSIAARPPPPASVALPSNSPTGRRPFPPVAHDFSGDRHRLRINTAPDRFGLAPLSLFVQHSSRVD